MVIYVIMFNAIRHRIYNDSQPQQQQQETNKPSSNSVPSSGGGDRISHQQSRDLLEHVVSQLKSQNNQLRQQVLTLQEELKARRRGDRKVMDDDHSTIHQNNDHRTSKNDENTLTTPHHHPSITYNEFEYWNRNYYIRSDPHRNACSNDIGFGLVERWRNAEQIICKPLKTTTLSTTSSPKTTTTLRTTTPLPSQVLMYRIQQTRHVAEDNFIRVLNMIVPLNSFSGNGFSNGWYANCEKDHSRWVDHDRRLFQLHLDPWMRSFRGALPDSKTCDQVIQKRLVLVQRDGEYNLFHSMTDFVNIFMNYLMIMGRSVEEGRLGWKGQWSGGGGGGDGNLVVVNSHIVLLDHYQRGYYYSLLQALGERVFTHSEYKKYLQDEYSHLNMDSHVCFEEVLMITPGGSCFLMKDAWRPNQCRDSDILKAFSYYMTRKVLGQDKHLVRRRGHPNTDPIKIVFSTRKVKETSSTIYRRIMNEEELKQALENDPVLQKKHNVEIKFIDFGQVGPIEEQIRIIHQQTDILIGGHGAGLTHSLWLPEEAVLVELFPSGFHSSFFRNLAKWRGIQYLAMQNDRPENVIDSQKHWTRIDPTEFVELIRAAVQIVEHHHLGTGIHAVAFDGTNEHHHL
ncbi:hypothetical protein C9374_004555 [Naegleria lovaniensis]|uniref:EGF domain-specific O-linked N-acetylglucosamine transferase n=1 Tax=Naegleria lovaniensis TaxID=51637 RepID=A0AA88GS91_NAELO|nr:uncharacterized protein C9374_004555 [Naegleria lovaniensis]KAG2383218.1 hypothetical protein C9374_004555 [Naegleria lovaniensis]